MVFIITIFTIFHKQIIFTLKPFYKNITYYMYAQKGVRFIFTGFTGPFGRALFVKTLTTILA